MSSRSICAPESATSTWPRRPVSPVSSPSSPGCRAPSSSRPRRLRRAAARCCGPEGGETRAMYNRQLACWEIDYGLVLVTPPAVEPLTLGEVKVHLRVDHTADDEDISDLITAARELCEEQSGRSLATQTWRLELDRFPAWSFRLLRGPLQSVTSIPSAHL